MIRRMRCSYCSWSGDELDALYRGFLRCPWCEHAVVPDARTWLQRFIEAIVNWCNGAAK